MAAGCIVEGRERTESREERDETGQVALVGQFEPVAKTGGGVQTTRCLDVLCAAAEVEGKEKERGGEGEKGEGEKGGGEKGEGEKGEGDVRAYTTCREEKKEKKLVRRPEVLWHTGGC